MSASLLSLPITSPIPGRLKRKRVLLVDASSAKRELRAEAMRKLGMDVDCACDISEARSWWRADLYNLVLVNMEENELGHRDKFCEEIRGATPPQQLVFLVGKPGLLADSPNLDAVALQAESDEAGKTAEPLNNSAPLPWGIMEASRRISAARSVFAARSTALRNRPTPPRDLEVRESRRVDVISQLASALQKEELL
jgi:CheY-like chemotaxis protein